MKFREAVNGQEKKAPVQESPERMQRKFSFRFWDGLFNKGKLAKLGSKSDEEVRRAVREIAGMGEEMVPALVSKLKQDIGRKNFRLQRGCAWALGEIGGDDAGEGLAAKLAKMKESGWPYDVPLNEKQAQAHAFEKYVLDAVVWSLGKMDYQGAKQDIENLTAETVIWELAETGLGALAKLEPKRAREICSDIISTHGRKYDKPENAIIAAVDVITALGATGVEEKLVGGLDHPDPKVRETCLRAIIESDSLEGAYARADEGQKRVLLGLIQESGRPESLASLVKILKVERDAAKSEELIDSVLRVSRNVDLGV